MTCCHYDEGYEDGLSARTVDLGAVLEEFAREYEVAGEWESARIAHEIASKAQRRGAEEMVERARKRDAAIRSLYAQNRTLAAA